MSLLYYQVNTDETVAAMVSGEPWIGVEAAYGANEQLLEFLLKRNWFEVLGAFQPDLHKENGKDPVALNRAWALFNLAHVGHLEHVDPLLRDPRLMQEAGFTAQEVTAAHEQSRGVIHRDTLRNHLKRLPISESERVFYEVHLPFERHWRALRGGIYAADGFEIEVCGKQYEGTGERWDPKEKRYIRGYKVLYLFNTKQGREHIIGVALGPINSDERGLLLGILERMRQHGVEPKDLIELLILDRGYWGAQFLQTLGHTYGLDWLTLVPANTAVHDETQRLIGLEQKQGKELRQRTVTYRSGEQETIRVGGIEGIVACDGSGKIQQPMNTVLVRETDAKTGEVRDVVFATSRSTKEKPHLIAALYSHRWAIENECNRELSQRWQVRTLIGRRENAIYAQLVMVAMLYNAMKDYRMKHPKEAEELQVAARQRPRRSYLEAATTIVLIPGRGICAAITPKLWRRVIRLGNERSRQESRQRTLERVRRHLEAGLTPEEALVRAEQDPE